MGTFTVETSMSMCVSQAAHGARMGATCCWLWRSLQDGDYQRLEGEGCAFSLRDSDSMDSSKNVGLSMKSIV